MGILDRALWKRWASLAFAVGIMSIGVACATGIPADRNPALPVGFKEAPLPDVPINGYLYLSVEKPLTASIADLIPDFEPPPGVSGEVEVNSLVVWVSPNPRSFGMVFDLGNEEQARVVEMALSARKDLEFRYFRRGALLYTIHGSDEWTRALEDAIDKDSYVSLETAYPDVNLLFNLLPEEPGLIPVASGFGRLDEVFLTNLEGLTGTGLSSLKSFISGAKAENVVVAMYAKEPLSRLKELNEQFFQDMGLGAVLATHSSYPGFLVSLVFKNVASGVGLQNISLDGSSGGEQAYYFSPGRDVQAIVKNNGSNFYIALSLQREEAEQLMLAALGK